MSLQRREDAFIAVVKILEYIATTLQADDLICGLIHFGSALLCLLEYDCIMMPSRTGLSNVFQENTICMMHLLGEEQAVTPHRHTSVFTGERGFSCE